MQRTETFEVYFHLELEYTRPKFAICIYEVASFVFDDTRSRD